MACGVKQQSTENISGKISYAMLFSDHCKEFWTEGPEDKVAAFKQFTDMLVKMSGRAKSVANCNEYAKLAKGTCMAEIKPVGKRKREEVYAGLPKVTIVIYPRTDASNLTKLCSTTMDDDYASASLKKP